METNPIGRILIIVGVAMSVIMLFFTISNATNDEKARKVAETYGFSSVMIIDQKNEIDSHGNSIGVFYCVATNAGGNPAVVKVIKSLDGGDWKIRVQGDMPDFPAPLKHP
ncbi:MAG: hypothetical protein WC473_00605 [Patescibacteria group bacterium]